MKWTRHQDEKLGRMWRNGTSAVVMIQVLNCDWNAIASRAHVLNLGPRSYEGGSPCRITRMDKQELEDMLRRQFGRKLEPVRHDKKRPAGCSIAVLEW